MLLTTFRERMQALGALPLHQDRVLRDWLRAQALDQGRRRPQDFLPKPLRLALPELHAALDGLLSEVSRHRSADATRLLWALADGQTVESVLLPREGVCVSSQVGCAVGCQFCMTGKSGLIRQLSSLEILAQVVRARRLQPVKKVVFMGMGEPAHNLANVMEAIEWLGLHGNIAHKNLVFSTVGDPRVFERLPQGPVRPALALSLHTTRAELRAELLPRAPRMAPEELVEAGEAYARLVHYPIQYQWTLIEGVNDSAEEFAAALRLLKGKYAVLNLIPYNAVPELAFRRPSWDKARAIARQLTAQGVLTKLRDSAGQEIDGGCGQLRARKLAGIPVLTSPSRSA
ncbi:RNA methyltransferase [Massilia sp. TS11]|uniref:RNA methyltransferase n=1 Tax=Massilia sp. TS11 TaxID=2908003 RepID=UPI001EDB7CCC|nr:RNA methyltransferase [Massilia sp. TS11]MCG2584749.1 RNA methyltransferase [Massilia sp. TS11]